MVENVIGVVVLSIVFTLAVVLLAYVLAKLTEFDPPLTEHQRAEHDRAVAEAAWDDAVSAMQYGDGSSVEIIANDNPFRSVPKENT